MGQYVIISKNIKTGGLAITIPSNKWLKANNYNYSKLAEKRNMKEYKIANIKDLPKSRLYRNSWRYSDLKECIICYKKAIELQKYEVAQNSKEDTKTALKALEAKLQGISEINNLEQLRQLEMEMYK